MLVTILFAIGLLTAFDAEAKTQRSQSAKAEFKRLSPCPSNSQRRGPCPGHVVDHVIPLCAGGLDRPSNMQWQTVDAAKIKDRDERSQCRAIRR